jgi:hypothetical protein
MPARQPAVIFDRDGTSFSIKHHQDEDGNIKCWHCYNGLAQFDSPVPYVAGLMQDASDTGHVVLMTSGREDKVRRQFEWANDKANLPVDHLIMRQTGDQRPDHVVKEEMYRKHIEPFYDVKLVVDDRDSVCDMWRSLGLPLVQVKDPGILPRLAG